MNLNNFRGDLTDVSAKIESLTLTSDFVLQVEPNTVGTLSSCGLHFS